MKIGIDCRSILNPGFGEHAGIGHYTYALVEAMLKSDQANRYVLFFDREVTEEAARTFAAHRPLTEYRFVPYHRYKKLLPGLYTNILFPFALAREKCDVVLFPSGAVPTSYRGKSVATAHDFGIFKHPEWFPTSQRNMFGATKQQLVESFWQANRVIAVSRAVQQDLLELAKIPEKKIDVIYEGVTPKTQIRLSAGELCDIRSEFCDEDIRATYRLPERFVLFLGTVEPRKNVHGVIRAFAHYVKEHPGKSGDLALAIAGAKGFQYEKIFSEIDEANDELEPVLQRRPVKYLGYVTTEEKWALMRYAECFVFPSYYEGFGLSVLEAMSVGTPVVAGNFGAQREVVGEAGILVDPEYTQDIYHGLAQLLDHPETRERLRAAGMAQAAKFTWAKAARETLNALHKAVMGTL